MAGFRVEQGTVSLKTYDVVGSDGERPRFICHVGLAESEAVCESTAVPVLDMSPPLHAHGRAISIAAHAVGRAELSDDEVQKIRTFVDQHASEHLALMSLGTTAVLRRAAEMYCVHPHAAPFTEEDGRYARMRFSCAGFVFEAYKFARIVLVDLETMPLVDLQLIESAYPTQFRWLQSGRITLDSLGLHGTGPWPVLLCGYLFHSLDRQPESIRSDAYGPLPGDELFTRIPA